MIDSVDIMRAPRSESSYRLEEPWQMVSLYCQGLMENYLHIKEVIHR